MISQSREIARYCSEPLENIENYDKAVNDVQMWHCHHRREIDPDGTRHTMSELIESNLYFNRPADELIFMPVSEHFRLHFKGVMMNHPSLSVAVEMTRISDGVTMAFPSTREAERWLRANGFPRAKYSHISDCCKNKPKHKSAYGCTWRFKTT